MIIATRTAEFATKISPILEKYTFTPKNVGTSNEGKMLQKKG
jgi:hypothetical protein